MNSNIFSILRKPPVFTKSEVEFWNDPHISRQMLSAHLNPDFEGASRKLAFIEKSVAWIQEIIPPATYPLLLDVGCGPGIYAEKFALEGYQVTGIDFSKRSIDYARQSALHNQLDISYIYQDYLEMDIKNRFDFSTMIYCDYGALSTKDRKTILSNIYHHLKPGGRLLLDVFSKTKYEAFQEKQAWEMFETGGFWRSQKYLEINGFYKYPNNVTLELISIITENEITPYYLWNTYFSPETLIQETQNIGFKICDVFGDVTGSSYTAESNTIAILLER